MKFPARPPNLDAATNKLWDRAFSQYNQSDGTLIRLFNTVDTLGGQSDYLHWDDFRFRKPPIGLSPEEAWVLARGEREKQFRVTSSSDPKGKNFGYVPTDFIARNLHEIDSQARGAIQVSSATPNDHEAERYLIKSLLEEPFNSSLLEGAATTRDQAVKLIRENKTPTTVGERMILNNYRAMNFIRELKNEQLTIEIIHELHRILTEGTLEKPEKAGKFRDESDIIDVVDDTTGEVLHHPPDAGTLSGRIEKLCEFANKEDPDSPFIHPILRAIILHFMLAYEHPYVDGNGRTARALFYWAAVRSGYWLLEYASISLIINKAPIKYGMAFLHTETDGNDLTYFFHHQLNVIKRAMDELHRYIQRKQREIRAIDQTLNAPELRESLNHRQIALLHDAVRSFNADYTIADHQRTNGVSYLTARADLERLVVLGFLTKTKRGNRSIYKPTKRLKRQIPTSSDIRPMIGRGAP